MKSLFNLLMLSIALASCTSYQYVTLKSDLNQADASQNFYYQDSLVRIDFNFWGENFPVSMNIENTGERDLYLDLARTLFLKDDEIISNAIPNEKGRITGSYTNGNYEYYGSGAIHAVTETKVPTQMVYIPKGKKIVLKYDTFIFPFSKKIVSQSQYNTNASNETFSSMRLFIYPNNVAPRYSLRFFFKVGKPDADGYIAGCSFWPNMVISGTTTPRDFDLKSPSIFYTKKTN